MKWTRRGDDTAKHLMWFALYLAIACVGRWQAGSLQQDFAAFEDQASHFVTASMIREGVTGGAWSQPKAFVEDYYLHFPKVGLGQWPPMLHGFLGALMIPLGVTRWAVFLGAALIAAFAASALRGLACLTLPRGMSSLLGLLFLALPTVQAFSAIPMTELMIAGLGAMAVQRYAVYLRGGSLNAALGYGLFTLVAVVTKGNGVGLILVAALSPWLAWQPRRWVTKGIVISAAVIGLVGSLWYLSTMNFSQSTWAGWDRQSGEYFRAAFSYYSTELSLMVGGILSALALLGIVAGWVQRESRESTCAMLAWLLGLTACHLFIRTGIEARHVTSALPILLVLAGQGALFVWKAIGWSGKPQIACATGMLALGVGCQSFVPIQPKNLGYQSLIAQLAQNPDWDGVPWLIVGDALGEGLCVAEAVLHDPSHSRMQVLRASKVLAQDNWLGQEYSEIFPEDSELGEFLKRVPVGFVILDESMWRKQWFPHVGHIQRYLHEHPEQFEWVGRFPRYRDGEYHDDAIVVYRQTGYEDLKRHPLVLEDVLHRGADQISMPEPKSRR